MKTTGSPKRPPFVLSNESQKSVSQTLHEMTDQGHIPNSWTTSNLRHCFEHPSFLKAHDWLLLAGPVGKYVLQVRFCSARNALYFIENALCQQQ